MRPAGWGRWLGAERGPGCGTTCGIMAHLGVFMVNWPQPGGAEVGAG